MILIVICFGLTIVSAETQFPYEKFLGLTSRLSKDLEDTLKSSFLCSIEPLDAKFCSCSKDCMRFRSCCMDYLWISKQNETIEAYQSRFTQEALRHPKLECKPVAIGLAEHYTTSNFLMRSACPTKANPALRDACIKENVPLDVQPVLGKDGYIYKNFHCALCNQVDNHEKLQLEAKDCYHNKNTNSTLFADKYKGCVITTKKMPDDVTSKSFRTCSKEIAEDEYVLPNTSVEDLRLCESYGTRVGSVGGPILVCFKNFHCLKSSTGGNLNDGGWEFCPAAPSTSLGDGMEEHEFSITYSISKLVSFDDLYAKKECNTGKFYDQSLKKCVEKVQCGFGQTLVDNKCVRSPDDLLPNKGNTQAIGDNKIEMSQAEIMEGCLSSSYILIDKSTTGPLLETISFGENTAVLANTSSQLLVKGHVDQLKNLTRKISSSRRDDNMEVIRSNINQHYITNFYQIDFHRTFPGNKLCAEPMVYKNLDFKLSANCWVLLANKSRIVQNNYLLNIYSNGDGSRTEIVKCAKFHLDSTCLKRPIDNYTLDANKTLIDHSTNRKYTQEEYTPLEDGVGVCLEGPRVESLRRWQRITGGVETYITVVGCILSFICYIWVMLTYTIIPALKTIPGKNIVCLCSMLLFSDAIVLVSMVDVGFKVCAAFGILLHFFALSAQVWAGIVAFDIWSTFHGRGGMRNVRSNKRFHTYLLIGYLIPAVVVLVCVTLELTNTIMFGYGLGGICWIALFQPRLAAYIAPMVVITVFNIVALSYTIACICKQSQKSKKLLKKSGGQDVSLARMTLKLVILLGVVEILGLIQVPQASSESSEILNSMFRIIFATARAFRGVFIWLLYIVTDRVFSVYKDIKSQRSLRTTTMRSSFVSSSRERRGRSFKSEANSSVTQEDHKLMQAV